jgi:DNA repair exonuclease SbcCD ATPase subunit
VVELRKAFGKVHSSCAGEASKHLQNEKKLAELKERALSDEAEVAALRVSVHKKQSFLDTLTPITNIKLREHDSLESEHAMLRKSYVESKQKLEDTQKAKKKKTDFKQRREGLSKRLKELSESLVAAQNALQEQTQIVKRKEDQVAALKRELEEVVNHLRS